MTQMRRALLKHTSIFLRKALPAMARLLGRPRRVLAPQIGHRTAFKPFAGQPPAAARRDEPLGASPHPHGIPGRAGAARAAAACAVAAPRIETFIRCDS